ncbi:MAG: hypothetical protein CVU54_03370 [Deltaproteobacteria bacterium HGW-Deltaproteobacteria-12]|nr:MAG: hypothetical protein CVU54_03370 [Deltaproteobacteria bacterium HGW-Deltaproteobacteria-12]
MPRSCGWVCPHCGHRQLPPAPPASSPPLRPRPPPSPCPPPFPLPLRLVPFIGLSPPCMSVSFYLCS